jgi:hypothetical protein
LRSPCAKPPAGTLLLPSSPNRPSTSKVSWRTSWSWSASAAILVILPSREKIDNATLSKTLSPSNRLTIWKLRAMPALIRS